ncbi:energy-coupling factor transporter transmembrane component T family protein [Rhizobium tumorigenes]|uniref:energy-coupling factor transporter transmembrane component T family protein n=1 Tax=Rhizobium tumorigenes TaxID=2041385 RepID=UPI00241F3D5C|nr:energy-coupling factor transporter transmembrane protein EcfT [Rhizobium tumorigenes]WFS01467.1 energy-coupling factor transporter transmembrane protein EcfT [Rhizobium tumorigenes]
MQSLYVDADSWMHRLSARLKLIMMALLGIALFATGNPGVLVVALLTSAILYFTCGMRWHEALQRLRPVLLTIAFVSLFSLLFNPWEQALVTILRLVTLTLFAATVTATTTIADFMDEITWAAMPLERTGLVKAADIGLAVGLVVRFVPEIVGRYAAIREAHQARGLTIRVRTTLVPLIILTLRDADAIAAAIDARGIRRH